MGVDPAGIDENQLATEILAEYTGLTTSWLKKLISRKWVSMIDVELLRSSILYALIRQLRKVAPRDYEPNDVVAICRTIAAHKAQDAVKCAMSLKRPRASDYDSDRDVCELQDHGSSSSPNLILEADELFVAINNSLDENHRQVFELKRIGWSTQGGYRLMRC